MAVHVHFELQLLLVMVEDNFTLIASMMEVVGEVDLGSEGYALLEIDIVLFSEF